MDILQTTAVVRLYSHADPDDHRIFAVSHLKEGLAGNWWEERQDRKQLGQNLETIIPKRGAQQPPVDLNVVETGAD